MRRITFGAIVLILFGLGNLAAQLPLKSETVGVSSYESKNFAEAGNFFFQENELPRCKVADPTGTPLNMRDSPNGKVVGTLKNGTIVYIAEESNDDQLRTWAKLKFSRNGKIKGWVLEQFLNCQ